MGLICIAVSLMFWETVWADDPTPEVPLNHPVYAFLDRSDARGWIPGGQAQSRPFSRKETAEGLIAVVRRAGTDGSLSRTERGILNRHLREFAWELARLGYILPEDSDARHAAGFFRGEPLYAYRDSVAEVSIDPLFRQSVLAFRGSGPREETVSQTYLGGILRGVYRNRLGYRLRHFEAREWSTGIRLSRADVVARPLEDVQPKGDFVDFREAAFQLVIGTPWADLDVGKGAMDWGPGRSGNLMLANGPPPFGLLRIRASYGRVRYVHVAGVLRARLDAIDTTRVLIDNGHVRSRLRAKRFAAHRLEIRLFDRVKLGLQESVVYADRGFELLYVTPVTILAAVQNHLGNRDNLLIGLDLTLRPADRIRFFGALLFDDLQKFSPSAFSNKYGLHLGVFWVDPVPDTDVQIEFAHLEPFTYSHHFQINTYEHYDALLGYPTGPNADRWFGRITHRFSPGFSVEGTFDRERQGQNPLNVDGSIQNVGGEASLGRRPADPLVRDFMSGEVETRTRLGAEVRFEPIRDLMFRAAYQSVKEENLAFPDGVRRDGRTQFWTAGAEFNFF